ncbi:unnamed protein product [Schistocephalus solidus]|uniref:Reverse transcriptase domain-containing protein n=1 Tax=Schistocephalus solidus TaxID=70667 RepID=A0A183TTP6_SCHSO|nr:unnamed protein product [Schistocephalus solidus]
MLSVRLMDAYREERPGIPIDYRTNGKLVNHRLMHQQSRVSTANIHELLFPDDGALNATAERDIKRSMNLFADICENFGLLINTEKTAIMH